MISGIDIADSPLKSQDAYVCCSGMRTTLILNDALASEARKRAAERNTSVSAIVNEALLKAFRTPSGPDQPQDFKMPTYAPQQATKRHLSPQEMDTLMVADDLTPYRA